MSSKLAAAAAAASNSSEEGPAIGQKAMPKVQAHVKNSTGATFAAGGAGATPTVAAAAKPKPSAPAAAAPARNASLAPILIRSAAAAAAASSAAPVLVSQGAAVAAGTAVKKPPAKPTAAASAAAATELTGGPAASALVDKKVKKAVVIGVPGDSPQMAEASLTRELKDRLTGGKERLELIKPVTVRAGAGEATVPNNKFEEGMSRVGDNEYRPLSSASFPDFIIQTFSQYSPYLQRVIKEGAAAAEEAAAEGEGAKNDCDSIKKKNMEDVSKVLDAFVNEKQANIPAIIKRIDPTITEMIEKLKGKKIPFDETKVISYVNSSSSTLEFFKDDVDKIFLADGGDAAPAASTNRWSS